MITDWAIHYQQNKHLPLNKIMESYNRLLLEYQEQLNLITQQSSPVGAGPGGQDTSTGEPVSTYGVMNFNGSAFAIVPPDETMRFGTSPFTIECWINFSANPASSGYYFIEPTSGILYGIGNYGGYFSWFRSGAAPTSFTDWTLNQAGSGNILSLSTWYHIAVTRDDTNTIRFYVNGTASTTTANDPNNYLPSTNGLRIGSTYSQGLNGKISNFRVINGTALYTGSSFVVPSLPLTDVTNTVLLMKSVTNATVVSDSSTYAKSITNTSVTWTDGPIVYP
jgi:hypothetical protein